MAVSTIPNVREEINDVAASFTEVLAAIDALPAGTVVSPPPPAFIAAWRRVAEANREVAAQIRAGGYRPPIFSN
jgi:hypothetical protein